MTLWPVTYFIGRQLLGEGQIESLASPDSLAYFCATCGDIWARVLCGPVWHVEHAPCEKHQRTGGRDWSYTPGCLTATTSYTKQWLPIGDWGRVLEHLPPAVLRREWELTLKHYEEELR